MKLEIEFVTANDTFSVRFDLLDNPAVKAWVDYCQKLPAQRRIQHKMAYHRPFPLDAQHWAHQQKIQHELANTAWAMPLPVTDFGELTQHHLNVWHRWYTENTQHMIADQEPHAHFWLQELNQIVHVLENNLLEYPKNQLLDLPCLEIGLWSQTDSHGFTQMRPLDLTPYREYHSWEPCELVFEQSIHGKSTLVSFLDDDDPRHWDTTGHHMSFGGCVLVLDNYRQRLMQTPQFQAWLDKYSITKQDLWPDFPLGRLEADQDRRILEKFHGPNMYDLLTDGHATMTFEE